MNLNAGFSSAWTGRVPLELFCEHFCDRRSDVQTATPARIYCFHIGMRV